MPRLTSAHIEHIGKGAYLRPVLEEKAAFQVAGVMTLVEEDRTVIARLWELVARELDRRGARIERKDYFGIAYYPETWDRRGCLYMAGVEMQGLDVAGGLLVVKPIPALEYARFIHKGPTRDMPLTLDYVFHTWLPKSGKRLSAPLIIERYGEDLNAADDEDSERAVYVPIE
jgi:AraC family transcriptional regulator